MIRYTTGNLLQASAEALVNAVNCVGVMGKGIALQFKQAFPENYEQYRTACERGEVRPGQMFVHSSNSSTGPRFIINFPTKQHWKDSSRLEDIETGLDALVSVILEHRIKSIALPALGSGLGGLDWPIVRNLIEQKLSPLPDVTILVYEPQS
jgi:O-acetyl-ADP-ribose deacetylase (regulator of RNase III)